MIRQFVMTAAVLLAGCAAPNGVAEVSPAPADSMQSTPWPSDSLRPVECGRRLPLVVFDGNSYTVGSGATIFTNGYVDLTWAHLGGPRAWDMVSNGIGGLYTLYMDEIATKRTDPRFDPLRPLNVVMAMEGTNDLGSICSTPDQAYKHFADYSAHRHAVGFTVVLATILPRVSSCAGFEASRQEVNARIRESHMADVVVDIAADPEIGAAGAEMGPNFAKDHVHPSDAGHAIIAHHVTLALALLAAEARP